MLQKYLVVKIQYQMIFEIDIYRVDIFKIMLSFLLPFASKIVSDAVNKIPDDAELGESLIKLCVVILEKAVKLTKTDMDDKLLETVKKSIETRQEPEDLPLLNIHQHRKSYGRKNMALWGNKDLSLIHI